MKVVQQISLLALALTLASCNEKVSPELQNASVTTGGATSGSTSGSGSGSTTTNYTFKLTNTADESLNFKLHKTGPNNADAKCEVSSSGTPLSHRSFGDTAVNDITCYLEAEELSLYYGGLKLKMEATPNTCEYLAYTPFSYWNRMPGDSTGKYTQITCMNDDTTNAHVATALAALDRSYDPDGTGPTGPTSIAGCGDWLSNAPQLNGIDHTGATVGPVTRNRFSVNFPNDVNTLESQELLCRFNYTDKGEEKCDNGTITVDEYQVTFDASKADAAGVKAGTIAGDTAANPLKTTYSDASDDDGAGPDDGTTTVTAGEQTAIDNAFNAAYGPAYTAAYNAYAPTFKKVTRSFKCGGAHANCIDGPVKKETTKLGVTKFTQSVKDQAVSAEYTYPTLFPNRGGTYVYANFRKTLANNSIDYISTLDPLFKDQFIDQKVFDPLVLERFSSNVDYDNTAYTMGPIAHFNNSVESFKYSARPWATEAFRSISYYDDRDGDGVLEFYGTRTNPFYTFECLDTAREPKARIRLMVRDWDRIFPVGLDASNTELLSDIYFDNSIPLAIESWARQDNNAISPRDGDSFNDFYDWDNILGMQKTSIAPYVWAPTSGNYLSKTGNFPNENTKVDP